MINHAAAVSSLLTHPSQQFEVSVVILPSFRMDMPGADVHGLTFPPGRKVAVIREKIDKEPDFNRSEPFAVSDVICSIGRRDIYEEMCDWIQGSL